MDIQLMYMEKGLQINKILNLEYFKHVGQHNLLLRHAKTKNKVADNQ